MRRSWVGVALGAILGACGGNTSGRAPHRDDAPAVQAGTGGRDEGSSKDDPGGGLGGDELGGTAGVGGEVGAMPALEQLAGRSFTFGSSLCSSTAGWEARDPAMGVSSLYVRRAGKGLEIVTYTRAGGAPIIEIHPLESDGAIWKAKNVVGCAWLDGYEDFRTESERADWTLEFRPVVDGGAIEVLVTAALEEGDISAVAHADVTPPTLSTFAEARSFRGLVDEYGSSDFSRYFVFSEPLAKSEVLVEDRQGRGVAIQRYLAVKGYVWGFVVTDDLSSDAHVGGEVEDLAGLQVQLDQPYPGIEFEAIDGDFEQGAAFETSDIWIGEGPTRCGQSGADSSPGWLSLPPIQGQRSFLLDDESWDRCSVFFRVARSESSTKLGFTARKIELADDEDSGDEAVQDLRVCVSSLDAGDDRKCTDAAPTWTTDEAYGAEGASVSLPAEISVPLSVSGDDLWVEIDSSRRLWLDSLHTE